MGRSLNLTCIIINFLDVFIQMNTGYYDKGVCIQERALILKYYFRKYFVIDFFVNFVVIFYYNNSKNINLKKKNFFKKNIIRSTKEIK
jgi:hypothetical protein